MRSAGLMSCSLLCALTVISCAQSGTRTAAKTKLETDKEKLSYAIGMDIAQSLKTFPGELDLPTLQQGLSDARTGKTLLLSKEDAEKVKQTEFAKMRKTGEKDRVAKASDNLKQGTDFLAKNKTADGVITTASGLQYKVIKQGTGAKPKATDIVTVHYVGTTLDGKVFDSSRKRGQPTTFPLANVIPGWTEGLQLMPVGSTYKFFIPSTLAYGERGAGKDIGPNATLQFEVELISIGKPTAGK